MLKERVSIFCLKLSVKEYKTLLWVGRCAPQYLYNTCPWSPQLLGVGRNRDWDHWQESVQSVPELPSPSSCAPGVVGVAVWQSRPPW